LFWKAVSSVAVDHVLFYVNSKRRTRSEAIQWVFKNQIHIIKNNPEKFQRIALRMHN
jgi:hypothetical protein